MAAINFPDPAANNPITGNPNSDGWYNSGNGVTYQYSNGLWTAANDTAPFEDIFVDVDGDKMTGALELPADPTGALEASTKQYVDNEIAAAITGSESGETGRLDNRYLRLDSGANNQEVLSTGNTTFNGSIGIGVSNPRMPLEVKRGSNSDEFYPLGINGFAGSVINASDLETANGLFVANRYKADESVTLEVGSLYSTDSTFHSYLHVDGGGHVGINCDDPKGRLHVVSQSQATYNIDTSTKAMGLLLSEDGGSPFHGGSLVFAAQSGAWRFAAIKGLVKDATNNSVGELAFCTRVRNTDSTLSLAMIIANTGKVGIGTAVPLQKFVVSEGGAQGLEFNPYTETRFQIAGYNRATAKYIQVEHESWKHLFKTGETTQVNRVLIDDDGYIGINNMSPLHTVDIKGASINLVNDETVDPYTYLQISNSMTNGAVAQLVAHDDIEARLVSAGNHPMTVFTNKVQRLSVLETGRIEVANQRIPGDFARSTVQIAPGAAGGSVTFGQTYYGTIEQNQNNLIIRSNGDADYRRRPEVDTKDGTGNIEMYTSGLSRTDTRGFKLDWNGRAAVGPHDPTCRVDIETPDNGRVYIRDNHNFFGVGDDGGQGGAVYFGSQESNPSAGIEVGWGGATNPSIAIGVCRDNNIAGRNPNTVYDYTGHIRHKTNGLVRQFIHQDGRISFGSESVAQGVTVTVNGSIKADNYRIDLLPTIS